jgi:hypothetical protein
MKRLFSVLGLLVILLLACNLPTTATQAVTTEPGITGSPAKKHTATVLETQALTETPAPETNASCNELSFYLDPELATSYHCETVPESNGPTPFVIYPAYTKVSLEGYVLSDRFMNPVLSVFPIAQYSQLLPDPVKGDVTTLQDLISGAVPTASAELPLLPPQYARQLFYAQYIIMPFHNGSGYHCVTHYAQNYWPVNNHDIFFSYQGLSSDGKYWISILLPISHPGLPENGNNPPAIFYNDPLVYYKQIVNQLNSELPKSFNPSILKLDTLIMSITIQS